MKAVIFDLDGTLLDTLDDLADSMNSALEEEGLPTHPAETYKMFIGDGARNLVERSMPESERHEDFINDLLERYKEIYSENWDNMSAPFQGIPELLDALEEKRIRCAVLSNKPHDLTVTCIEQLLDSWIFYPLMGLSGAFDKKPDPGAALHIAEELELPPSEISFLGDSGVDMQTAKAAGMEAVGASWGYRPEEELKKNGADRILLTPMDLLVGS